MNKKKLLFLNIRTKFMFSFLILSLIPFTAVVMLSFVNSTGAISSLAFDKLTGERETKRIQLEKFFSEQKKDLLFLVDAVKSMRQDAFLRLESVHRDRKNELVRYFEGCMRDIKNISSDSSVRNALIDFSSIPDITKNSDKTIYRFLEKGRYGDLTEKLAGNFHYYDLMLINTRGDIVFSLKKESDLGQNIFSSPILRKSALSDCFERTLRSSSYMESVIIEDLEKYPPSGDRFISFVGNAISERSGTVLGAVIIKLESRAINEIVQKKKDMGRGGECFLACEKDGVTTYRSDCSDRHAVTGDRIREDLFSRYGIEKESGVTERSLNGEIRIIKYEPLEIAGLGWTMTTSLSLEEAISPALSDNNQDYFSKYISVYGFSDLLLISSGGDVFYSVKHGAEYGTNLINGPFSDSSIGKLFKKSSAADEFSFVGFSSSYHIDGDRVSFCDPVTAEPFAFIGKSIVNNGITEMVVALKMPLDMVDRVMREQAGRGKSGAVYLVGTDGMSRSSIPGRTGSNTEDQIIDKSTDLTTDKAIGESSRRTEKPVISRIESVAVKEALSGREGHRIIDDYRGIEVLSSYAPIKIFNTTWAIIAEIDKNVAFQGLKDLKLNTFLLAITSIALIVVISSLISNHFAKPIAELTAGANRLKKRVFDTEVQISSNDEFDLLAQAFNEMAAEIRSYSDELELKVKTLQEMDIDLRKSNNILNSVMNGTTDAIFLKDRDGRYIMGNLSACNAIGKSIEELLMKRSEDLLPPDLAKKIESDDRVVLDSGKSVMAEISFESPDGTPQWWLSNKNPYRENDGSITGIIGIARNITNIKNSEIEKKKLENQLRQSQKMEAIGTLAAGVAHDFNNILSAIQGYSEMVMYELSDFSSEKMSMEKVLYACHRAKQLVRQILTFSRITPEVSCAPQDICEILQETMQLIRASTPTTVEIETDLKEGCGAVLGDPIQIHQVIMNICTNAAHAMDEKGGVMSVRLNPETVSEKESSFEERDDLSRALKPGRYIKVSIGDTGKGIEDDHIDRIFDPYFTTKPMGKGAGMGLAVANGIVQGIGGVIEVRSSPGEGTTFTVWFPSANTSDPDLPDRESDDTESNGKQNGKTGGMEGHGKSERFALPGGRESVLVVDDEPDMVEITARRLESLGYQVTGVSSGIDALSLFESLPDKFDLIVTDQTMPKLTGAELAEKVMKIRDGMPVIICTGYSNKIDADRAKEMEIDSFLMKPVDFRELAFEVRKVLDRSAT